MLTNSNDNMIKDGRKCLEISYNLLNLPSTITRNNAEVARYRYLSDGTKLGVTGADGKGYTYMGSMIYSNDNGNLQLESTDFAGGRIYATTSGAEVRYHLCDHLGSPRVVLNESMEILEQNDYYAFGLRHENPEMMVSNNRFRYNGKEEQRIGALDVLDYGKRMYDPELGMWKTCDPLLEKYYPYSPYNYCLNNPVRFIDPNGTFVDDFKIYKDGTMKQEEKAGEHRVIVMDGNNEQGETVNVGNDVTLKEQETYRGKKIQTLEIADSQKAKSAYTAIVKGASGKKSEFLKINYQTSNGEIKSMITTSKDVDAVDTSVAKTKYDGEGNVLLEMDHNHPRGTMPSSTDKDDAELYPNK